MGQGPRRLRDLLGEAYASMGVAVDSPETILRMRWPEAVGADIAAMTEVDKLERGRLVIRVDGYNSTLTNELSMRQEEIREKLNGFLEKEVIKEVQVKGRTYYAA